MILFLETNQSNEKHISQTKKFVKPFEFVELSLKFSRFSLHGVLIFAKRNIKFDICSEENENYGV